MSSKAARRAETARRLQEAAEGVYLAHGVDPSHYVSLAAHPLYGDYAALPMAKMIADTHAYHNGNWELGSCDGELFKLEWEIYLAELPEPPEPSWRDRLDSIIRGLTNSRLD